MIRRKTKQIFVGSVPIGGGAPISVQSMTNTNTGDVPATLQQIKSLAAAGCDIVRVAVPDKKAALALPAILAASNLPVIADIHFDYQLALAALKAGVHGLRLNPGNIGGPERVKEVANVAKSLGTPIRVGVNSGSVSPQMLAKFGGLTADAMVESALIQVRLLESCGFDQIKVSLKASRLPLMLEAYAKLAQLVDYPFHIGVTEAGLARRGSIKSAAGMGALLGIGIGDTLRVSLTGDPLEEVFVAKEILRAFELRQEGIEYVVCPTCGRTGIDLEAIAEEVEDKLSALNIKKPLRVAVMGCVVNGPGEAKDADVGLAGGLNKGVLFCRGKELGYYPANELVDELIKLVIKITQEEN